MNSLNIGVAGRVGLLEVYAKFQGLVSELSVLLLR